MCLVWIVATQHGSTAIAQESGDVRITLQEKWTTVFGNSMVKVHFDVSSKSELKGLLKWAYTANARTIHAGEQEIQIAKEGSVTKEVLLRVPPVNEGVAFPTELTASITQRGQAETIASFTRRITIFHRNPLFERSKWLKELSISLFDPPGDTADVFQMMEIPFDRIRNVEALPKLEDGLLIVGEGVSFERYRFLATALSELAASGVPVLCLAPKDGDLTLPLGPDQDSKPQSMVFRGPEVITKLDKRLDSEEWMSDADIVAARIQLQPGRNRIVGEVSIEARGWSWIELQNPKQTRLVYCGFGIIKRWDDGPTPRYLMVRLLEHLTQQSAEKTPEKSGRKTP